MVFFFLLFVFSAETAFAQTGYTGIFGGGPFYKNAAANIQEIQNSGFSEAIVWSVEVSSTGDLNLNGEFPLTSNGVYIGAETHPDFAGNMTLLKQGNVKRVTLSIGSSNYGDWENITALVEAQGTGPGSILYQDFQALKTAIPALDAVDFDDENSFNLPTTVQFGVMLGNLGYHVLPDAYDNNTYWMNVVSEINSQLPGTADGVHLQAYAGGQGNNPCSSEWNFGSVPVFPGLWDHVDTYKQVQSIMSDWHSRVAFPAASCGSMTTLLALDRRRNTRRPLNVGVGYSGFALSAPTTVYLNQNATAKATIKIDGPRRLRRHSNLDSLFLAEWRYSFHRRVREQPESSLQSDPRGRHWILLRDSNRHLRGDNGELHSHAGRERREKGKGSGQQVTLSSAFNVYGIYTRRNAPIRPEG